MSKIVIVFSSTDLAAAADKSSLISHIAEQLSSRLSLQRAQIVYHSEWYTPRQLLSIFTLITRYSRVRVGSGSAGSSPNRAEEGGPGRWYSWSCVRHSSRDLCIYVCQCEAQRITRYKRPCWRVACVERGGSSPQWGCSGGSTDSSAEISPPTQPKISHKKKVFSNRQSHSSLCLSQRIRIRQKSKLSVKRLGQGTGLSHHRDWCLI